MRGEHRPTKAPAVSRLGSSPYARGAPTSRRVLSIMSGIIPACAGSTLYNLVIAFFNGDHPRMRGEHV